MENSEYLTSSPVSEDFPLVLSEPGDSAPSPSVKSTHIASESLESTGRMSQSMRTSGQWRLTESQKREAVSFYEGGESLGKVAVRYGVTRQSMWDTLRRRTKMRDRIAALPRQEPTKLRLKRLATLRRYRSRAARVTRAQAAEVLARDVVCKRCGGPGKDIDHILAVSRGGQTELSNLQLLCRPCHTMKSRSEKRTG
jgi:5-methylcytosine-specific restriction endonuclease McrA